MCYIFMGFKCRLRSCELLPVQPVTRLDQYSVEHLLARFRTRSIRSPEHRAGSNESEKADEQRFSSVLGYFIAF